MNKIQKQIFIEIPKTAIMKGPNTGTTNKMDRKRSRFLQIIQLVKRYF